MRKFSLFLASLIFTITAQAAPEDVLTLSFEEYFKVEENQKHFEQFSDKGILEKQKEQIRQACSAEAKNEGEIAFCNCVADSTDDYDPKLFYYEGLYSYFSFQQVVRAIQNEDEAEVARLNKLDDERNSFFKDIDAMCEAKYPNPSS